MDRAKRQARRAVALFTLAMIAGGGALTAQGSNRGASVGLRGTVTDPVGGILPGATVTATNTESGETASTTTNQHGRYLLGLAPGSYRLEVAAKAFAVAREDVVVERQRTLNFRLKIEAIQQEITVIARAPGELQLVPGGVAEVGKEDIEEITYGSVEEVLALQPGVLARSRFGGDEVQFSVRGSGLRNNFHMRGINLLFNGRPYMDADGFGDFESLDLMATERVEVWKGANALRFGGNQAGGAINFVTPTGETAPGLLVRATGGSFGLFKAQVATGGDNGSFGYYASLSSTESDGYREYAAQDRLRLFSNFDWVLGPDTDLRLDLIYANVTEQLPGSLTQEEFEAEPTQANAENVRQRYGRDYDFVHTAFALDHRLDDRNAIAVSVHGHVRDVIHPIFQILDQDQLSYGADFAYRHTGDRARLLLGFSPQGGGNDEKRFENLAGARGELAANFATDVRNLALYGELQYDITPRTTLVAGGRYDSSRRGFKDLFLDDGDRSDRRTFSALQPKVGVLWASPSGVQIFGNISRSYEPPLLLELTSFGDDVGFIDLEAQDTWQFEVGSRGATRRLSWEASVFDWEVTDEIININVQPFPFAPFTIPSYRNVDDTRHFGVELGAAVRFGDVTWRSAYTWSQFRFVDDPTYGDNDLPGAPGQVLYTEVRYEHPSGFWIAPNVDASLSSYWADSANTFENSSFEIFGLKAGLPVGAVELFIDAANLADERYSGSVQVDSAIGRFLEPGNSRSVFMGVAWRRD